MNTKELRAQLDQIARLDKDALSYDATASDWAKFRDALVNFWRSGALQRLAELAEDGERWREYLSHHAVEQRAEVIATIDSARAPSVKEGKS
jgi:predicted transcriptional regulator